MTTEEPLKQKWYSIKEAAEYLDIGEPTLYRWMRDNQITFRKVGDSTRFWKEDLDAVMQVHPSEKDVEKVRQFCPACHHDELIEGRVQSTGLLYFKPKAAGFWTLKDPSIDTQARACTRCGCISWYADTKALAKSPLKKRKSGEGKDQGK